MRKKPMPMPVNLNDCILLWQMGYEIEIHDGAVISVKRRKDNWKMILK